MNSVASYLTRTSRALNSPAIPRKLQQWRRMASQTLDSAAIKWKLQQWRGMAIPRTSETLDSVAIPWKLQQRRGMTSETLDSAAIPLTSETLDSAEIRSKLQQWRGMIVRRYRERTMKRRLIKNVKKRVLECKVIDPQVRSLVIERRFKATRLSNLAHRLSTCLLTRKNSEKSVLEGKDVRSKELDRKLKLMFAVTTMDSVESYLKRTSQTKGNLWKLRQWQEIRDKRSKERMEFIKKNRKNFKKGRRIKFSKAPSKLLGRRFRENISHRLSIDRTQGYWY